MLSARSDHQVLDRALTRKLLSGCDGEELQRVHEPSHNRDAGQETDPCLAESLICSLTRAVTWNMRRDQLCHGHWDCGVTD
jgi:hypothetical protein